MKLFILSMAMLTFSISSNAQTKGGEETSLNCYQKWESVFENKGTKKVEDGLHDNIVITIRKGVETECFLGRAKVSKGIITHMQLKYEDDSFEDLIRVWKHPKMQVNISNGMSKTRISESEEMIDVLFINHILLKKKKLAAAPNPDEMFPTEEETDEETETIIEELTPAPKVVKEIEIEVEKEEVEEEDAPY